jgi:hypothetical protein
MQQIRNSYNTHSIFKALRHITFLQQIESFFCSKFYYNFCILIMKNVVGMLKFRVFYNETSLYFSIQYLKTLSVIHSLLDDFGQVYNI